ncbi:hypothetical protein ACA910_019854 [Epithemia clementina (nom. ined.)]
MAQEEEGEEGMRNVEHNAYHDHHADEVGTPVVDTPDEVDQHHHDDYDETRPSEQQRQDQQRDDHYHHDDDNDDPVRENSQQEQNQQQQNQRLEEEEERSMGQRMQEQQELERQRQLERERQEQQEELERQQQRELERQEELKRQQEEEQRLVEEQQQQEEQQRILEDQRQQELQRQQEEQQRILVEQRLLEEQRQHEEQQRLLEEQRQQELQRQQEQEQRQQELLRQQAEQQRLIEEERLLEEQQRQREGQQRQQQEDQRLKDEQQRLLEDPQQRLVEQQRLKEEEQQLQKQEEQRQQELRQQQQRQQSLQSQRRLEQYRQQLNQQQQQKQAQQQQPQNGDGDEEEKEQNGSLQGQQFETASLSNHNLDADDDSPQEEEEGSLAWPVHYAHTRGMTKSQRTRYMQFMNGCYYKAMMNSQGSVSSSNNNNNNNKECDRREAERLAMNREQPRQMTNFTAAGYAKVNIPLSTNGILQALWTKYGMDIKNWRREQWETGSIYTNAAWSSPTELVDVNRFLTLAQIRQVEWDVKQVLEGWSGVSLVPTSTYGIRIYTRDSILAPHVDRLPLVLSAILHVAHDNAPNKEAWPLQVIGHNGVAVNLTLQPGEMILYESHSVIHGRPYPLQGDYYANLFVHFEPVGYTHNHMVAVQQRREMEQEEKAKKGETLQEKFQRLLHFHNAKAKKEEDRKKKLPSGRSVNSYYGDTDNDVDIRLPPYLWKSNTNRDTDDQAILERRWKQDYEFIRDSPLKEIKPKQHQKTPGATNAHTLAASGQLQAFKDAVEKNPALLDKPDTNGWKPIHEAARGGHAKLLQYLIDKGADVNERTNKGQGASPLWWALQYFQENHPAVLLLRRHGAVALPPRA